jgi:hypothetical protein
MSSTAPGDPDTGVDVTTAVGAPVAILALIAVVCRFWTRHSTKAGFRWDDWMVVLALLGTIATDILVLWGSSPSPSHQTPHEDMTCRDFLSRTASQELTQNLSQQTAQTPTGPR